MEEHVNHMLWGVSLFFLAYVLYAIELSLLRLTDALPLPQTIGDKMTG